LALQDLPAAVNSLAFVEQRSGKSLVAHYYRARIALLKNDHSEAVAECQRALAIDPRHVPSNLMLAAAHLGHGSLEQGEEVLQGLLAADPQNPAARKLLAQVYLAKRRPADARRLLESQGAADDAQTDWLMGVALTQTGETEPGLAYLERSIATAAPNDPRRLDLAAAYLGAGAADKASEILAQLPDSVAASSRAASLRLATAIAGKTGPAAHREVERLIASSPRDAQMLAAAGAYLLGVGQLQRSQEVLAQAAERDPKALNARMMLALLAARRFDWSTAAARVAEVLAIEPDYQSAFLMRAEIELRRGDRDQAQRTLEQAIGRDPSALEPRLRLARLAFANNDPVRGRDLLKQTVAGLTGRADVRNAVGMVLLQAGLHEEALVHFAEAGAAGLPDGMLNAARVQIQLNRLEQASEAANAAAALRPGWSDAQRMLIEIDVRRGQVDRALATARKQAGEHPPAGLVDELEGDVYWAAKQPEKALAAYDRAQRLRPTGALAVKIFRVRQGLDRKPVEASLLAWLARRSDDLAVRRILAGYYELTNQRRQAIAHYELAVKQSPADPLLLNNLAWQLYLDGNPRARELARRAYELSPHIPEITDTYGWLLVQTGEMQQGLKVLEQALAAAPANPDIRYHVAAARSQSGNTSGAVQILDDLLKGRTAFASRAEAEKLLERLRGEGA
jgi:putative PEP-CTERM system TPR-repeat lipoprotein